MKKRLLFAAAPLFFACSSGNHVQIADPAFDAVVASPAYSRSGPRVLFDDAHDNFHKSDGRYASFVTLLRNDGYEVVSNKQPLSRETLEAYDVLVIANARGANPGEPAFTAEEVAQVGAWVESGGALLLIADHAPFGAAANALSERFGVIMLDGNVKDPEHSDPGPSQYILKFEAAENLLGDHEILRGRNSRERIERVVTFGGQALRSGNDVKKLLPLSATAVNVKDPQNPSASEERSVAGEAQAVALTAGRGRVVVLGEAGVFSAQLIRGDVARQFGVEELRIGMSRTDTNNRQFALNTMHWLSRLF